MRKLFKIIAMEITNDQQASRFEDEVSKLLSEGWRLNGPATVTCVAGRYAVWNIGVTLVRFPHSIEGQ